MLLVLAIAAGVWGIGAALKIPTARRWPLIGLLFAGVIVLQLVLPLGHPVRALTGQSAALWLILAGIMGLGTAYGWVVRRLRMQAQTVAEKPVQTGTFTDTELNRYARHMVLREIGGPGQKALKNAKVLVIGAGGLGAPALQYLAAAGVGTIGVIDDDTVENTNLQRQVIHKDAHIGMPKVFSAQTEMEALNPFIQVRPYHRRLEADIVDDLLVEYDVVLDGTDNFATRYMVNAACVAAGKPLISGALSQWEGQLSVFDPAKGAPCYRCIFPQAPAAELAPSCAEAGVLGPLPGVVGAMMAVEAVKIITNAGATLRGEMVIYDALFGESRKLSIAKRPDCPTCGTGLSD